MAKENFIRFKNQMLGGTVLRDGPVFAEILGHVDFEFWRNIQETEPYVRSGTDIRLDAITKGKIILERLEKEPSPKRFAEMLSAVYEALALFSATPKNLGDSMWLTYVHRLQAEREATEFDELHVSWIKEPETTYTSDATHERYYIPGALEIGYTGEDWGVEQSQRILEDGFASEILWVQLEKRKLNTQIQGDGIVHNHIDQRNLFGVNIANISQNPLHKFADSHGVPRKLTYLAEVCTVLALIWTVFWSISTYSRPQSSEPATNYALQMASGADVAQIQGNGNAVALGENARASVNQIATFIASSSEIQRADNGQYIDNVSLTSEGGISPHILCLYMASDAQIIFMNAGGEITRGYFPIKDGISKAYLCKKSPDAHEFFQVIFASKPVSSPRLYATTTAY